MSHSCCAGTRYKMKKLLVVDLRGQPIPSLKDFWERIHQPCGLPNWFGRNLDAWNDTLRGGISPLMDAHEKLVIIVDAAGYFARGCPEPLASIFRDHEDTAQLIVTTPGQTSPVATL